MSGVFIQTLRRWQRWASVLLGASLICLVLISGAWGQPSLRISTHPYTITGTTATELRQQMNRFGPMGQSGRRFDAYTKWYIQWRFRYAGDGRVCRITQLTLNTDITYTMPRWMNVNQAPQSLQRHWQRYYQALKLHEDGHANHGKAATQEIWQQLPRLAQATCDQLEQLTNQTAQAIINRYAEKDREYDRQTDHGRTQGAVFP